MADVHDKKTRSYNMSQIRIKNAKPELIVRKFLRSLGFRFQLDDKTLSENHVSPKKKQDRILFMS